MGGGGGESGRDRISQFHRCFLTLHCWLDGVHWDLHTGVGMIGRELEEEGMVILGGAS